MNETVPGPGPAASGLPAAAHGVPPAGRLAAGVVAPVATVAVVLTGLRVSVPGGLPAVDAVAFAVTLAWAVAAAVCASRVPARGRAGPWPAALGALAGAVALTAARMAARPGPHGLERGVATVAGLLVIAVSVVFALSAPDGLAGQPGPALGGRPGHPGRAGHRAGAGPGGAPVPGRGRGRDLARRAAGHAARRAGAVPAAGRP